VAALIIVVGDLFYKSHELRKIVEVAEHAVYFVCRRIYRYGRLVIRIFLRHDISPFYERKEKGYGDLETIVSFYPSFAFL
jgi:hypothetical protein